jgi:signal transduction histidine kinase
MDGGSAAAPAYRVAPRSAVALGELVLFAGVVALVAIGLGTRAVGGRADLSGVAFALVVLWACAGVVGVTRRPAQLPGRIALLGAFAASVTLTAQRLASSPGRGGRSTDHAVATIAAPLVVAASLHLLLSLPDGRLTTRARRAAVAAGYAVAAAIGVAAAATSRSLSGGWVAASWSLVVVATLPALRARYGGAAGADRERLQWAGIGVVLAADAALVAAVLHALVAWPDALAPVAAGATALVPLGALAGNSRRLAPHGGRLFVHVLSVVGFTVVVSMIYIVVVLGLGHAPTNSSDREVLGLSMLAAAVAAVGYAPARDRLVVSATRLVYGAREAPDEVLRTFGSRLTRAVSMEELLLQLAESLRKTMGLVSAEVYTGAGDVLERAVSVPDAPARSLVIGPRERPVVTRAGVSGNAWASVWLPALLDGRGDTQVRVAPVSHGGELLGLIVVERRAAAEGFSEDDDRVLTDLARQVGLAFHNVQLDTALQTTLDELRKQADALRESRARIVASGDAERRRVERNLHDGAQQRLVALAVNLRLTRDVVTDDLEAGSEMLDQLIVEVQETIQELRELAHGIYPPLLVDSGLVQALRAAANRSPLPVDVIADGVGRYPPEVEAAVYFCCLEALQNAAKHAPDASVELRLWEESGGLLFSVADDGPGFDPERARAGHGFMNMADRLGAIGGTVRWESEPGHGAQVRGSVPLT